MLEARRPTSREWLQHITLCMASLLVPSDQRADWFEEWQSELWYIPQSEAMLFSLGAFRDAFWLRQNSPEAEHLKRNGIRLESPLHCLALLAALAAVGTMITVCLFAFSSDPSLTLKSRDLPEACAVMLLFSCLLLPGTLAVWRAPADRPSMNWPSRLRWASFLALKVAFVQPIMLCGFVVQVLTGPIGGLAGLGFDAAFILALRWVITDQQGRCPVCLRMLTAPVRIGTPSHTFLEWYGAESACPHGHGMLHVSKNSSTYSRNARWLRLDGSWRPLFSPAIRGRQ